MQINLFINNIFYFNAIYYIRSKLNIIYSSMHLIGMSIYSYIYDCHNIGKKVIAVLIKKSINFTCFLFCIVNKIGKYDITLLYY